MIPQFDWITPKTLVLAFGLSAAISIASLVLAPVYVARLPADYFQKTPRSRDDRRDRHPVIRITAKSLKNLLGVALFLAGVATFILPGYGVLTMLVGIALTDFPGKQRLERAMVRQPPVLRLLNWIRAKAHKEPFLAPASA
jgi:hypothetical protein